MKVTKILFLTIAAGISYFSAGAQTQLATNANVNIVTANAGIVTQGNTIDLLVTVANTGANPIQPNRIRPTITIPIAIAAAADNALQTGLPAGWIITGNNGSTINVCNGTDVIPAGATRSIIIKIQANAIGGPSTILGQLNFGTGTSCTGFGGSLTGDNPADNGSSTTITVIAAPVPITLLSFDASLLNCETSLKWRTISEVNSDRFEIERSEGTSSNWIAIARIAAAGNTSAETIYSFVDKSRPASQESILYRLKMIDKDGSFKYSDVLRVFVNCQSVQVRVYPNPIQTGKLFVSLAGTTGYTTATLYSGIGQLVSTTKMRNGTNDISTITLPDGIYYLHIADQKGLVEKVKVLIQQ